MTRPMTHQLPEPSARYQSNEGYRSIAKALVARFASLRHIALDGVLFVDDLEGKPKHGGRPVLAQLYRLPPLLSWMTAVGGPGWEYVVLVYKAHTVTFSREQLVAVLYHELRHIGVAGKLVHHDLEEFADLHAALGPNWTTTRRQVPDLLDADIDWTAVEGRQPRLTVLPGGLTPIERAAQGDAGPEKRPAGLLDEPDCDEVPF